MKFTDFIKRILSSPLKIVFKIVRYFVKIFMFALFETAVVLFFVTLIKNQLIIDISTVLSAYIFFGGWTYFERSIDSDAETDYTEVLGNRYFSFSYEIKDVMKRFKWNILLETFVFYIVFALSLPTVAELIHYSAVLIPATTFSYVAVPLLNVLIWVAVRKHWYKKYRRWARHKKTQEYVDNSLSDVNTEERT